MSDLKAAAEAAKYNSTGDFEAIRAAAEVPPSVNVDSKLLLALYAERDEARTSLERLLDPTLHHFRMENGRLDMALTGEAVQHISLLFVEWFRETGTENNIEMSFTAKTEPFERYTVTVQKWGGKTPAEQRIEANTRAEAAEASLASYKEEVERLRRALAEARDDMQAWQSYASDYFRDKHDAAGDLAKIGQALTKEAPHAG